MEDHDKLTEKIKPIIDLMNEKEFNYIVIAGKDAMCARYLRGSLGELQGMLDGFMHKFPDVEKLIKDTANEYQKSDDNQLNLFES